MSSIIEAKQHSNGNAASGNGSSFVSGSLFVGNGPAVLSVQIMLILPDNTHYIDNCLATVHIWMYDMYSEHTLQPKMVAWVDNAQFQINTTNILTLEFPQGGEEELSINVSCKENGYYQPGKIALGCFMLTYSLDDYIADKSITINIIDTKFDACWNILGARNILLTDPPIKNIGVPIPMPK